MAVARVQILLATFNGMAFLREQLASLAALDHPVIDVLASDDGSIDGTREFLGRYAKGWKKGRFDIIDGPRGGHFTHNFRHLILSSDPTADFGAFCDQDDLWDADKLSVAIAALGGAQAGVPALYGSRTRAFEGDRMLGLSPDFRGQPSFRNALVQSIAGANTMVLNRAALDLVRMASRHSDFISHDWWSYLIVSAAGGVVVFDRKPRISYRQHPGNLVGRNNTASGRLRRLGGLMSGQFRQWSEFHIEAIGKAGIQMTPDARATFEHFVRSREGPVLHRLANLWRSGVYRMPLAGQLMLYLACLMKKT